MRDRKGFTLIELLVVIAVIAVLMGILMPALRAARELGRSANCLANERSLVLAYTMDRYSWLLLNYLCNIIKK